MEGVGGAATPAARPSQVWCVGLRDGVDRCRQRCVSAPRVVGAGGYRAGVKQVVKVRMLPTEEQAAALAATLRRCNEAASWLSAGMHAERVHRKHEAQKRFYTEIKQQFGLSAQPAIRVIGKVADSYATLRANIDAGNYGPPGSGQADKSGGHADRFPRGCSAAL